MKTKILVVDDEESIRFTFSDFLTHEGYEVVTAKSYDEAVKTVAGESFDLLFADILLGARTGIDLLRSLKEMKCLCPVVMITGSPDFSTVTEALRLGAFDYIPKPVRQETLLRVTKMALKHKALVDEKEKYRANLEAIFRSVDDGVLSVDGMMEVVEVNDAMKGICGYSKEAAGGKTLQSLTLHCSRACEGALLKTIETRRPVKLNRVECRHRERPSQVVSLKTSPLIDLQGNFSGAVMVVRDETRIVALEQDLKAQRQFGRILGKSEPMQAVYSLIAHLADVDTTVLVMGESGTGKELVAEALHYQGGRSSGPLVKVNCAALTENLLESELFGHVKGAFTGAVTDKIGRFEKADGGTLFLDEIGDISPRMQLRLLRVLQEKEVERVGDSHVVKVDVRVVAATNRNLRQKVAAGEFREDLFYRLKVVEINLPPLRERREDIPLLIEHFLQFFNKKFNKAISFISDDVLKILLNYRWPGNIRELKHTLEHGFILCHGEGITAAHLPPELATLAAVSQPLSEADEKATLVAALQRAGGNKAKAARLMGVSRRTLYRKLEQFDLGDDDFS